MLRLGIDVDGVVADFRSAFRALAERELGIAADDAEADLTKADIERLWRAVAATTNWWLDVPAYEPDQIGAPLFAGPAVALGSVLHDQPAAERRRLRAAADAGLAGAPRLLPAVACSRHAAGARGELARSLRLDLALDDRIVNCLEITSASNSKAVMVLRDPAESHAREAAEARGVGVVSSLAEALDAIERLDELLSTRRGRLVRLADWFQVKKDTPGLPHDPRARSGDLSTPNFQLQLPRPFQIEVKAAAASLLADFGRCWKALGVGSWKPWPLRSERD